MHLQREARKDTDGEDRQNSFIKEVRRCREKSRQEGGIRLVRWKLWNEEGSEKDQERKERGCQEKEGGHKCRAAGRQAEKKVCMGRSQVPKSPQGFRGIS